MESRSIAVYIAKKKIRAAIIAQDGFASFEQIADWTEYECIALQARLREMVEAGEISLDESQYSLI